MVEWITEGRCTEVRIWNATKAFVCDSGCEMIYSMWTEGNTLSWMRQGTNTLSFRLINWKLYLFVYQSIYVCMCVRVNYLINWPFDFILHHFMNCLQPLETAPRVWEGERGVRLREWRLHDDRVLRTPSPNSYLIQLANSPVTRVAGRGEDRMRGVGEIR